VPHAAATTSVSALMANSARRRTRANTMWFSMPQGYHESRQHHVASAAACSAASLRPVQLPPLPPVPPAPPLADVPPLPPPPLPRHVGSPQHHIDCGVQVQSTEGAAEPGGGLIVHDAPGVQLPTHWLPPEALLLVPDDVLEGPVASSSSPQPASAKSTTKQPAEKRMRRSNTRKFVVASARRRWGSALCPGSRLCASRELRRDERHRLRAHGAVAETRRSNMADDASCRRHGGERSPFVADG
jgi:hypothetical protein